MTQQLGELRIGPLRLDFPVVQAALSGYSDLPMRVIARRLGAPYTLCEVMLDRFIVELKPRRKNRHFLQVADEEHPTGGQLMGAGVSMGQMQPLGRELFAFGREKAGEDVMGAIVGAIPGLTQFV